MAINLPLKPVLNVSHVVTPITGGNEYTTRFSTSDAVGQFVSSIHTATVVGQSHNSSLTVALYKGITAPLVTTVFTPTGATLPAGWVTPVGAFKQETANSVNVAIATSHGLCAAYNNSRTFQADQTVSVVFSGPTSVQSYETYIAPAVRMSADGKTYYSLNAVRLGWNLVKSIAGVITTLASGDHNLVSGDNITLSVIGPSLSAFVNGSEVGNIMDSSISAGAPGIAGNVALSTVTRTYNSFQFQSIAISQAQLLGEETIYTTGNVGTKDASGRLPVAARLSSDVTTNPSTYLLSGVTDPSAGLTDHAAIANAWLRSKGVVS